MQTDLPLTNQANSRDQLFSRALPPLQRWISLGMSLGLLLFYIIAFFPVYEDESGWVGYWCLGWMGIWHTVICLPAVWAALGRQPLTVRLPRALGLAAALMLTSIWTVRRSELQPLLYWALEAPVFFLVLFFPLSLFRWLLGWRIGLPEGTEPHASRPGTQFSLRQLVVWMGATAVLLAWAKCLVPDAKSLQVGLERLQLTYLLIDLPQAAVSCLPIILTGIGLILGDRSRGRFALLTLVAATSAATLEFCSGLTFPSVDWKMVAVMLAGDHGGFAVSLFGTLLVFRLCGYRLLRGKEGRGVCESAGAAAEHLCPGRTSFSYLVGGILLIGLVLSWPAAKLEAIRYQRVSHAEFCQAWDQAGAYPCFEEGKLTAISFRKNEPVPEAGLKKLQELREWPTCESLYLGETKLTDDQMRYLRGLPTLKSLRLEDTPVSDVGLSQLDGLDSLQDLTLSNTRITDEGLKHLQRCEALEYLFLEGTKITGTGFAQLDGLPRLRYLDLARTQMTDEGLAHLRRFASLEYLDLTGTPITGAGFARLGGLQKLTALFLVDAPMTDETLRHLTALKGLEHLALNGTRITDAGVARLVGMERLTRLGLGDQITDAGLKDLAKLKNLTGLWLSGCRITDVGLVHLAGLRRLKELGLARTPITDAGLKHLQQLEDLEVLWLEGTRITDTGLAHLRSLKKLRFLNPYKTQVTERGLAEFSRAMPGCEIGEVMVGPRRERTATPAGRQ